MTWNYEKSKADVSRDLDIPYGTVKKWGKPPGYVLRFYTMKEELEASEKEVQVLTNVISEVQKSVMRMR